MYHGDADAKYIYGTDPDQHAKDLNSAISLLHACVVNAGGRVEIPTELVLAPHTRMRISRDDATKKTIIEAWYY